MDFDYHYLIALIFAASAFFGTVTVTKLIQKLNDKIDAMDMRLLDMQSQVEVIVHEATAAKQVSLNAWDDAKKRHAEVISVMDDSKGDRL